MTLLYSATKLLALPYTNLWKIWSSLKVDKPRFTRVHSIRDKNGDMREPTWLGTVYRDQILSKNYLVVGEIYEEADTTYREVRSVAEIVSAKNLSHAMTEQEIQSNLQLKTPDIDVESDIIDFLKKDTETAGAVFYDLRERAHSSSVPNGTGLAYSLS